VAIIRRRCPSAHRQPLIDKLAEETTRGFVPTQAVRAVVAGLCAEQNDSGKAEQLIDLIRGGEKGVFTEAQVRVLAPDAVIDSPSQSKPPVAPPRRRGPEESVIRHGLDFVRAVEHVGDAPSTRGLIQALRSVHVAAGGLLERLGHTPKEQPVPPTPPVEREAELTDLERELLRILREVQKTLSTEEASALTKDRWESSRVDRVLNNLRYRGFITGDTIKGWQAIL